MPLLSSLQYQEDTNEENSSHKPSAMQRLRTKVGKTVKNIMSHGRTKFWEKISGVIKAKDMIPDDTPVDSQEAQDTSSNVLFPEFPKQEQKKTIQKPLPDITKGLVFVSKIAKTFSSYKAVDQREWNYLLKNKSTKLVEINQYLSFVTQQNAAYNISLKNIVPIPRIQKIFWEISQITDPASREKSMKTFIAYYIRFLAIRRDFLMNNEAISRQKPATNVVALRPVDTVINWEYIAYDEYDKLDNDHDLREIAA